MLWQSQNDRPDVEAPPQRECERSQAFCHACDSISAVGIVPAEGLQHYMGSGQGDTEMLGIHNHKVSKEFLDLRAQMQLWL